MSSKAVMNPKCYKSGNSREWGSGAAKTITLSLVDERVVKLVGGVKWFRHSNVAGIAASKLCEAWHRTY
jgi:hypothetical protein